MKKITIRFLFFLVTGLFLHSCQTEDDVTNSPQHELQSKNYVSKSLWKEDEVFIKNVKQIFEKNLNKSYFIHKYGEVYWNYAMSFDHFDESFLQAPIVKNGKVEHIMTVNRIGNKIFFSKKTDDSDSKKFFQSLIFNHSDNVSLKTGSSRAFSKGGGCITRTVTWTWTDSVTGEVLQVDTFVITECLPSDPTPISDCLEEDCTGGGGGGTLPGGGYPYPLANMGENACDKIRAQNADSNFKSKVQNLKSKTGYSSESGFRVGAAAPGSGQSGTQYQELSNKPGTQELDFRIFPTTYGIMHTHYDGLIPIFSPGDINLFILLLQNAHANNIPLNNVFISVVTSQGTYQLRGDGINIDNLMLYTDNQIITLNEKYKEMLENPNISSSDLKKGFLSFMKDYMKIEGAELYEITDDDNSKKLQLNNNNTLMSANCPQ
ncbi:MAG: hypothetical protein LBE92_17830 [Chryseobacterium sp.]|jgi:hypothetical protein|uniref:hypothetical protein n=1 Tax=Chryseobacterium sp. TaxID=1871047 RepID=UPI002820EB73|nr:hypothetical protein [Chryseobacterium sp.]MDR2237986.1 hypothetical protein [Chryseobacterium sp.]